MRSILTGILMVELLMAGPALATGPKTKVKYSLVPLPAGNLFQKAGTTTPIGTKGWLQVDGFLNIAGVLSGLAANAGNEYVMRLSVKAYSNFVYNVAQNPADVPTIHLYFKVYPSLSGTFSFASKTQDYDGDGLIDKKGFPGMSLLRNKITTALPIQDALNQVAPQFTVLEIAGGALYGKPTTGCTGDNNAESDSAFVMNEDRIEIEGLKTGLYKVPTNNCQSGGLLAVLGVQRENP